MQKPNQIATSVKRFTITSAKILALLLPIFAVAVPTYAAWEDVLLNVVFPSAPIIARMLSEVLIAIIGGILAAIYSFAQTIINEAILNGQAALIAGPQINDAWKVMLSATNVLLMLALGIMAILIITGQQNYNIKKALTALLYAVVIANLSYDIVQLIVGLGDALTDGIKLAFQSLGAGNNPADIWIEGMKSMFRPLDMSASAQDLEATLIIAVTTLGVLGIGAYVMVKLALLLIERAIRLAISIVLAPLVFILQLFPGAGLDGLAKNWWSDIIKWTLVLPAAYLMLGIAGLLMPGNDISLSEQVVTALGQSVPGAEPVEGNFWEILMLSIAAIAVTQMAGNAAGLLKLDQASGKFFKPIDGLVGAGGAFLKKALWTNPTSAALSNTRLAMTRNRDRLADRDIDKELAAGKISRGRAAVLKTQQAFARAGQWTEDTIRKNERAGKDAKDALEKAHLERQAKQDKTQANAASLKIDQLAHELWLKEDPANHTEKDLEKFKTNHQDQYIKFRQDAMKADPTLADAYKLYSKRAGSFIDEEAKKEIDKGMDVATAAKKLTDALEKPQEKALDIEKFAKVLKQLMKSSDEDERRDAANALRDIARTGDNAAKIITVMPDFSMPAQPPAPTKTTAEDLAALADSKLELSGHEAALADLRDRSKGGRHWNDNAQRAIDGASSEALEAIVVKGDTNEKLIEAVNNAVSDPASEDALTTLVRKINGLSVEKQGQISVQIEEARKITDDSTRNRKISDAIRASGLEIDTDPTSAEGKALNAVSDITGRGLGIKSVLDAGKLVKTMGTKAVSRISSDERSWAKQYASASITRNQTATRAQDIEDDIADKTANGRTVMLNAISKNPAALQNLQDFDDDYQDAVTLARTAGISEAELRDKPFVEILQTTAASSSLSASDKARAQSLETRLRDKITQLAQVNQSFVSTKAYNEQQAVAQATAADLATAAYAIKYQNQRAKKKK